MSASTALDREALAIYGNILPPDAPSALQLSVAEIYGQPQHEGHRKGPRDPRRSEQMVALREAGHTLEEIGAMHGITRERTRQILDKAEKVSRPELSVDPLAIVRAVRASETRSLGDVNRLVFGYSTGTERATALLSALGLLNAVQRLFRLRKYRDNKVKYLDPLRAFYDKHGRSPYSWEMAAKAGVQRFPELPYMNDLSRIFGSAPRAFALAGIPSRATGGRGHVVQGPRGPTGPRGTHCKRGHERTPENRERNGRCCQCRRAMEKARNAARRKAP